MPHGVHRGDPVSTSRPWSPWSENFSGIVSPAVTVVAVGYAATGEKKPLKSYTTEYERVAGALFPAPSLAATVKVWSPTLDVSSAAPAGTSPLHEASPEPPAWSVHE